MKGGCGVPVIGLVGQALTIGSGLLTASGPNESTKVGMHR